MLHPIIVEQLAKDHQRRTRTLPTFAIVHDQRRRSRVLHAVAQRVGWSMVRVGRRLVRFGTVERRVSSRAARAP